MLKDKSYTLFNLQTEEMTNLRNKERKQDELHAIPTVHPRRENCTPPAIEQVTFISMAFLQTLFDSPCKSKT